MSPERPRRGVLGLLGGAAAASLFRPLVTRAENAAIPVIGFLHSGSPDENARRLAAFRKGLDESGFVEGGNVVIEYRWAAGHHGKLAEMAAELVDRKVVLIVTAGSTPGSIAAKRATATIPIVFAIGADPVDVGLVASLSRPGGNATGATTLNADAAAKRLGILRELAPDANRIFALVNTNSPLAIPFSRDLRVAARKLRLDSAILQASTDAELDAAFASVPRQAGAVLVSCPDSFFYIRRERLARLTARHAVPAVFDVPEYVDAGCLVSYGADFLAVMRQAGLYSGRILKGEKPRDLPVVQAAKFELAINRKTAAALGPTITPSLLAQADEVIE